MNMRKLKALKIARSLANRLEFRGKVTETPTIAVIPRTEYEYPIGRKNISVQEILNRNIEIVPDPDAPEPKVEVVRKKDGASQGFFTKVVAEAMILKAKAQKKATLIISTPAFA
jgi:hypothetical protein